MRRGCLRPRPPFMTTSPFLYGGPGGLIVLPPDRFIQAVQQGVFPGGQADYETLLQVTGVGVGTYMGGGMGHAVRCHAHGVGVGTVRYGQI